MRPEKIAKVITAADFINAGIPEAWAELVIPAGFTTPAAFKEAKPTAIQQKLNGLRKKNKLDIPALTPDIIEAWQANIG
jgi:lysyl-tRNA synthetase class 2